MFKIQVYYHLYIPQNEQGLMWTWWVDEQLGLMKTSKLTDVATINMCITMPMWWVDLNGKTFSQNVTDYINTRYPFVNIVDVRDTGQPNLYEGQTLRFLYDHCKSHDGVVLYLHSKGVRYNTGPVACWRQILNHFCITEWPKALMKINDHDLVGVRDATCDEYKVSGNFWWAKNEFIRSLSEPLDSKAYEERPSYHPGGPDYRYSFETWLWNCKPNVGHLVNTNKVHYDEYCFLESLTEKIHETTL